MLFIINLCLTSTAAQDYRRTIITDPSISRRCNILVERRRQKITHKQQLAALLLRNEKLQQATPLEKKSLLKKLKNNHRNLQHELQLTSLEIKNQEENAIRKGCPGITL